MLIIVKGSDNVEYYSVKEIAKLLSVNEETVRRWIRDEKLEAERGSGRQGSKVTSKALAKFLDENKGLMTTIASSALGLSSAGVVGAAIGGVIGTLASPLALSASWLSIFKAKDKDKNTIKIELMEKEIELENIALRLKNEIDLKQNELELIKKQISKLNEMTNELNEKK